MNLHEYQAKALFRQYKISVPHGVVVNNVVCHRNGAECEDTRSATTGDSEPFEPRRRRGAWAAGEVHDGEGGLTLTGAVNDRSRAETVDDPVVGNDLDVFG